MATRSIQLDPLANVDLPLAQFAPSTAPEALRSGSIRIAYSYPYEGVLQAELSIRDENRNTAYTIVGRPSYRGIAQSAYLPVQAPTADTYLDVAFLNPTSSAVTITLSVRQSGAWNPVQILSLKPNESGKVRLSPGTLRDTAGGTPLWSVLLKADYSVTSTEIVSNAWMEDEKTGFSNTALLHDQYPQSNTLFATQLVSRSFPAALMPNGPVFDGSLVFVNVDETPSDLTGSLFCDIDSKVTEIPVPPLRLQPFATQVVPVESLVMTRSAQPAVCSGQFQYSGRPGFVIGRYYAASQSKTYGLYVKLEPFVGWAYNEVYWSIEDDFVPLLTVSNFADEPEVITMYIAKAGSLVEMTRATVPARGTFTFNVRDKLSVLRQTVSISADYGGMYIRAQNPRGKILVKQHAVSARRLMMAPYYGGFDYIASHFWSSYPSQIDVGGGGSVTVTTCYSVSGCFWNQTTIYTSNPSALTVDNGYAPAPVPINGQASGTAGLTAPITGPTDSQGTINTVNPGTAFVQVGPVLLSCNSPTRGSNVTCQLFGITAARVGQWQFQGSGATVTGPSGQLTWSGTAAAGGTVSVSTMGGGTPQTSFSVSARNFHTMPASAQPVANGIIANLPVPPQSGGSDSGLGIFAWRAAYSGMNITTISSGPNTGFSYYASNLSFSEFWARYTINPDLENSGSTFATKQWGACGFISYNGLLTQTRRHEYNHNTLSHWGQYNTSMGSAANNLGDYVESRVANPGTNLAQFNADTGAGLNNKLNAIASATAAEPPCVNCNESGMLLGNINFYPYVDCP